MSLESIVTTFIAALLGAGGAACVFWLVIPLRRSCGRVRTTEYAGDAVALAIGVTVGQMLGDAANLTAGTAAWTTGLSVGAALALGRALTGFASRLRANSEH